MECTKHSVTYCAILHTRGGLYPFADIKPLLVVAFFASSHKTGSPIAKCIWRRIRRKYRLRVLTFAFNCARAASSHAFNETLRSDFRESLYHANWACCSTEVLLLTTLVALWSSRSVKCVCACLCVYFRTSWGRAAGYQPRPQEVDRGKTYYTIRYIHVRSKVGGRANLIWRTAPKTKK